jgi:hypothetical protein
MMTTTIQVPPRAGSRSHVAPLVAQIPQGADDVAIDFGNAAAATQSFVDELVKALFVDRRLPRAEFVGTNQQVRAYAKRSAATRDVTERLILR